LRTKGVDRKQIGTFARLKVGTSGNPNCSEERGERDRGRGNWPMLGLDKHGRE
jgi:hypothetical protein